MILQHNHTGNLIKVAYFFTGMWYNIRITLTVMHKGRIVEIGTRDEIVFNPVHPYTKMLIDASIKDEDYFAESLFQTDDSACNSCGCKYHALCKRTAEKCRQESPALINIEGEHFVACHLF